MLPERGLALSRPPSLTYRPPQASDGPALWALAGDTGLDRNSPYAYLLWCEYFAETSVVAELDGVPAGFVNGFRVPGRSDTLFVWQVGVAGDRRGQGIATAMLVNLVQRCTWVRHLEATVNPTNTASAALFRGMGARYAAAVEEHVLFDAGLFPEAGHEAEVRFRIGPLPVG